MPHTGQSKDLQVIKRLLHKVANATCNITPGGGGGGTGDASEATLLNILAELQNDIGITETQVFDSAGIAFIRRTELDLTTGVRTTTYLDPQTNAVSTPTFPLSGATGDSTTFNEELVVDDNGDVFIRRAERDAAGAYTVVYLDPQTELAATPVFPLQSDTAPTLLTPSDNRQVVTTDGTIPAGTVSYRITNLGTGAGMGRSAFTVDGDTIPAVMESVFSDIDTNQTNPYPAIPYTTNGNQLFIEYTILI